MSDSPIERKPETLDREEWRQILRSCDTERSFIWDRRVTIPRLEAHIESLRVGLSRGAEPENQPVGSPSRGADEELKEALKKLTQAGMDYQRRHGNYGQGDWTEIETAEAQVENLFSRMREERDRLEAECLMELLHEGTGKMLPVRVRTVVKSLVAELSRVTEERETYRRAWNRSDEKLRQISGSRDKQELTRD